MNDEHPHPLLAQVALIISPHLALPHPTILPHTYVPLPSILPPSITEPNVSHTHKPTSSSSPHQVSTLNADSFQAAYVLSPGTGHAAHPSAIISSNNALSHHLEEMRQDADSEVKDWLAELKEKDLAEKRRVAPGWLDVNTDGRGLLVPERKPGASTPKESDKNDNVSKNTTIEASDEGAQLDKAFGVMKMQ